MTRHLHSVTAPVAEDLAAQHDALNNPHPCPICGAERDAYCVNTKTGTYLHNRVSHWQRIPRPGGEAVTSTNRAGNRDRNLDEAGGLT